jgi:hypothetical protein
LSRQLLIPYSSGFSILDRIELSEGRRQPDREVCEAFSEFGNGLLSQEWIEERSWKIE